MKEKVKFNSIEEIVEDIKKGKIVIVLDDESRENEGDLVTSAQYISKDKINFMAKYGRGLICLPIIGKRLDELHLGPMVSPNTEHLKTDFAVSVDAKKGISTGISAEDRAHTIRTIINKKTKAEDLVKPGHVFPLRAKEGGVLVRAGHTEAAVDLMKLAHLFPAGVICEIMNEDGTMARLPQLREFARRHNLKICTIAQIIEYRHKAEKLVRRVVQTRMRNEYGDWRLFAYESIIDKQTHIALVMGKVSRTEEILVRVHSQCLTGDVFGSFRCDCGEQLKRAMEKIKKEGKGVILYLCQEGRGIGLLNKLKAYALQDKGVDTVEANKRLGFKPDLRDYGIGAQILADLGLRKIKLLTNNPQKVVGLAGYNLKITRWIPLEISPCSFNRFYLKTKKEKLGHRLTKV
ncbi:MAG: bifunctional 3,4-dihydroxy-2-butanone-4-phosphate synthase/GTP cyclohydrolase II [Candidatus Omnitrophota bacterium]|nr:MAG: bifunctional 3,4-dihydroxy-2-butanone-4-phosphate synthase/GTP cyclohydrolase II [Candidatus Omnitrophota bacterium]